MLTWKDRQTAAGVDNTSPSIQTRCVTLHLSETLPRAREQKRTDTLKTTKSEPYCSTTPLLADFGESGSNSGEMLWFSFLFDIDV